MSKDFNATQQTMIMRMQDSGDISAWQQFTEFYWDVITGWARRSGCNDALAQEVFQEVCVNLCKSFNYDVSQGKFRPWLKTLVRRRAVDAFRRETRQRDVMSQVDYHQGSSDLLSSNGAAMAEIENAADPYRDTEGLAGDLVWLNGIVAQAMRNLYEKMDATTYKSFTMYVLDGLPVDQVASRLDLKEATVYQHRTRFLNNLEKEFVTLLRNLGDASLDAMEDEAGMTLERLLDRRLSGEAGARTNGLKALLAQCITEQRHLRGTMLLSEAPKDLTERLHYIQNWLGKFPKEKGQGAALLLIVKDQAKWVALDENLPIGRTAQEGLFLPEPGISSLHASLKKSEKGVLFKDENSTNGSYVNGQKVDKVLLKDGDVIQLSAVSMIYLS